MSRKTKRPRTAAQIAAELERSREKRAQEAAASRAADKDPAKWGVNVEELERQGVEVTQSVRGGHAAARPTTCSTGCSRVRRLAKPRTKLSAGSTQT